MNYSDSVYGSYEINDSVLLDLINSEALQRLTGVLQHGVSALVGITRETSRFEHSLGVMYLVKMLGGSLEEQIASILHDVSHTVFSHVIDYVFGSYNTQSYHEIHKLAYISSTDIPDILKRHKYDWEELVNEENFSLLEQEIPKLCADRLDYFLRDAKDLGVASDLEVSNCIRNLLNFHGRIVVNHIEPARWMGYSFIEADKRSWANFREVGLYELAAKAIRRGLEIDYISHDDLWGQDKDIWNYLGLCSDEELQYNYRRVNADTQFVWDEESPEFRISTKLRSIDPEILLNGSPKTLSELDEEFSIYRENYISENSGKWPMRVISSM